MAVGGGALGGGGGEGHGLTSWQACAGAGGPARVGGMASQAAGLQDSQVSGRKWGNSLQVNSVKVHSPHSPNRPNRPNSPHSPNRPVYGN